MFWSQISVSPLYSHFPQVCFSVEHNSIHKTHKHLSAAEVKGESLSLRSGSCFALPFDFLDDDYQWAWAHRSAGEGLHLVVATNNYNPIEDSSTASAMNSHRTSTVKIKMICLLSGYQCVHSRELPRVLQPQSFLHYSLLLWTASSVQVSHTQVARQSILA